jgi:hypothetical protein
MGNAAGLNDVPEQVEIGEIEPHSTSFLFCEGRLRIKQIAIGCLEAQASYIMK